MGSCLSKEPERQQEPSHTTQPTEPQPVKAQDVQLALAKSLASPTLASESTAGASPTIPSQPTSQPTVDDEPMPSSPSKGSSTQRKRARFDPDHLIQEPSPSQPKADKPTASPIQNNPAAAAVSALHSHDSSDNTPATVPSHSSHTKESGTSEDDFCQDDLSTDDEEDSDSENHAMAPGPRSHSLPANWLRTPQQIAEFNDLAAGVSGHYSHDQDSDSGPQGGEHGSNGDHPPPLQRGRSSLDGAGVGAGRGADGGKVPLKNRVSAKLIAHPSRFHIEAAQHDYEHQLALEAEAAKDEQRPGHMIPRRRVKRSSTERSLHQRAVLSAQHQQLLRHASQFGWPGM